MRTNLAANRSQASVDQSRFIFCILVCTMTSGEPRRTGSFSNEQNINQKFEKILYNPVLYEAFLKYLTSTYCQESLQFW